MPEFIEGVVNLRGVIIPIVDLRKRFALSRIVDNPRNMRMMITKGAIPGASGATQEALLGLVVDSVQEVLHVPQQDIEPAPEAATGQHAGFITGMGKVGDRLIILIDITKILSQQERSALAEAGTCRISEGLWAKSSRAATRKNGGRQLLISAACGQAGCSPALSRHGGQGLAGAEDGGRGACVDRR